MAEVANPDEGRAGLPLSDVLVIDAAHFLAGSLVSRILADLGARVIKVEPPGGEALRGAGGPDWVPRPTFLALARDKECIELDLKSEDGVRNLVAIASRADVFIQNFRPGVAERLGVGADDLRAANPGLVYCAVSGFGSTGPWRASPSLDGVVQAFSGALDQMGERGEAFGSPSRFVFSDVFAGTIAAQAVIAALYQRTRTGEGGFVDISMAEAGLYARFFACEGGMPPPMTVIAECSDGEALLVQTSPSIEPRLFAVLASAGDGVDEAELSRQFDDAMKHRSAVQPYVDAVSAVLATQSLPTWLRLLHEAGVPASPRLTFEDALVHPQIEARGAATTVDVPNAGRKTIPASPFLIDGVRRLDTTAPRLPGTDTERVLRELTDPT